MKVQFLCKTNGSCNYGCGFTDKSLIDNDEVEIKQVDLGETVHVLYVKNKHHTPPHEEYEEESDDD